MDSTPAANLIDRFAKLNDPQDDRAKRHNLMDVVVIAICAVLCGADSWVDVELFGKSKEDWLRRLLELPNGIPSHEAMLVCLRPRPHRLPQRPSGVDGTHQCGDGRVRTL